LEGVVSSIKSQSNYSNSKGGPNKKGETSSTVVFGGLAVLALVAAAFFAFDLAGPSQAEIAAMVEADVVATQSAAEAVAATEEAAAIAISEAEKCYITPLAQYSNVGVRKSPEVTDKNLIQVLYRGDQIQAIGHNGRTTNVDRWWLVDLGDEEYAWVNSSVVEEITEHSCALLEKVPGS
jgi:hypothetical protein